MCGRFAIETVDSLARRYAIQQLDLDLFDRFNIAPTQDVPVVVEDGEKKLELMRWGLVPRWAKDLAVGSKMINARAETILEKPSFRKPLLTQRCLVPASGFYEWHKQTKVPYFFRLPDEGIFSMAGLYDIWKDDEGRQLKTFTVITTSANELMAPIHHRMPVILHRDDEGRWLDPTFHDPEQLQALLRPYPAASMEGFPVSRRVNQVTNEGASLLTPVE